MYYRGCCGGCWGRVNTVQWWIKKCALAREGMGVEELTEMVREIVGPRVEVGRMWDSLK